MTRSGKYHAMPSAGNSVRPKVTCWRCFERMASTYENEREVFRVLNTVVATKVVRLSSIYDLQWNGTVRWQYGLLGSSVIFEGARYKECTTASTLILTFSWLYTQLGMHATLPMALPNLQRPPLVGGWHGGINHGLTIGQSYIHIHPSVSVAANRAL